MSEKFPQRQEAHVQLLCRRALLRLNDEQRQLGVSTDELWERFGLNSRDIPQWRSGRSRTWACTGCLVFLIGGGAKPEQITRKVDRIPVHVLRDWTKSHHLSTVDLAALLGVLPKTAQDYLNGESIKEHFRLALHSLMGDRSLYDRAWRAETEWAITRSGLTRCQAANVLSVHPDWLTTWLTRQQPAVTSMARVRRRLDALLVGTTVPSRTKSKLLKDTMLHYMSTGRDLPPPERLGQWLREIAAVLQ